MGRKAAKRTEFFNTRPASRVGACAHAQLGRNAPVFPAELRSISRIFPPLRLRGFAALPPPRSV